MPIVRDSAAKKSPTWPDGEPKKVRDAADQQGGKK